MLEKLKNMFKKRNLACNGLEILEYLRNEANKPRFHSAMLGDAGEIRAASDRLFAMGVSYAIGRLARETGIDHGTLRRMFNGDGTAEELGVSSDVMTKVVNVRNEIEAFCR